MTANRSSRYDVLFVTCALLGCSGPASAQLINEVLARNSTQDPVDISGGHPDLVELYNDTTETLFLGAATGAESYALTDTLEFDEATAFIFPSGRATFAAGARLIVFCDGNTTEGDCELHAPFRIPNDGSELLTLWGPEGPGGVRPVIDRVFLPPLPTDVSFGRFPDGAGGPNVPPEEALDHFVFYPPGESSFGSCSPEVGTACAIDARPRRRCSGGPNGPGGNIWPRTARIDQSTHAPGAGEPVALVARVRDDGTPAPPNIARVEIVYRTKPPGGVFGSEQVAAMALDTSAGDGGILSHADRGQPLDIFSHWTGSIPGQPAGTRVEFYLRVEDREGASSTDPEELCHLMAEYGEGVGPCDREFGPKDQGCVRDIADVTCEGSGDDEKKKEGDGGGVGQAVTGARFIACRGRSTYTAGYAVPSGLQGVVINEIVPAQDDLLADPSETDPCTAADMCEALGLPADCCRRDEDFIELYNASAAPADLSGCFLSDSFFEPRGWRFPAGSVIPPATRVIVWLDRDGSKCPEPDSLEPPCFWECPDPNLVSMALDPPQFHATFAIDADGDQIFLYDSAANDFGLIHGVDFGHPPDFCGFTQTFNKRGEPTDDVPRNHALALLPDGERGGRFVMVSEPTPGAANAGACAEVVFRRGDVSGDGIVDISDGVAVLNFLFLGFAAPRCFDAADSDDNSVLELTDALRVFNFLFLGGPPTPPPGPIECGVDPTEDGLADCEYDCS